MMTVPISSAASSNALAGKYTVTIKSGHVTDDGKNAASEHTFTEEIMCDSSSASAALLGSTTTKKLSDVTLWEHPDERLRRRIFCDAFVRRRDGIQESDERRRKRFGEGKRRIR
jgi:hypothetical protein